MINPDSHQPSTANAHIAQTQRFALGADLNVFQHTVVRFVSPKHRFNAICEFSRQSW